MLRVLVERLGQVVSTTNDADRTFWLETCNDFAERRIAAVVNELRATDEEGRTGLSLLNIGLIVAAKKGSAENINIFIVMFIDYFIEKRLTKS